MIATAAIESTWGRKIALRYADVARVRRESASARPSAIGICRAIEASATIQLMASALQKRSVLKSRAKLSRPTNSMSAEMPFHSWTERYAPVRAGPR